MAERPPLRISFSAIKKEPEPDSPSTTGTPKIKLRLGSKSAATTPSAPAVSSTRPARKSTKKPKANPNGSTPTGAGRKRPRPADDDDVDGATAAPTPGSSLKKRKTIIKLKNSAPAPAPTPTVVKLKHKGKPPVRNPGEGYDSEASDREIDPSIESALMLRMMPGEDCDYLRKMIEEKKFGLSKRDGGADVSFKFLSKDGRRSIITIRGRMYAATVVDLPCIIEGMKSWDKKSWYKSADICQMLLVLGRVSSETEARNYELPREVDEKTWQFPHGLTPPMHWVRKRRFRKRISNRTIEAVEEEVNRLLEADDEDAGCVESRYEMIDHRDQSMMQSDSDAAYTGLGNSMSEYDNEQDAEGEVDESGYFDDASQPGYFDHVNGQDNGAESEDDLAAEMEAALEQDSDDGGQPAQVTNGAHTAIESMTSASPSASAAAETPVTKTSSPETSDASDADGEGSDDDDDDEEVDEDVLEQQQNLQQQREEIVDLEAAIRSETAKWEEIQNPILKRKQGNKVQSLKADLELKRKAIGEGGDD